MQTRVNQRRQRWRRMSEKGERSGKDCTSFFLTRLSRFSRETRKPFKRVNHPCEGARCKVVEIKGHKKRRKNISPSAEPIQFFLSILALKGTPLCSLRERDRYIFLFATIYLLSSPPLWIKEDCKIYLVDIV